MDPVRQQAGKPVYKELLWSKPETKALSGNLLVIGGSLHAISAPSTAYTLAYRAGAGDVRVVLPDKTKRLLGPNLPAGIELVKSTPSGSFSKDALEDLLSYAAWANAILFAGDLSHNSETAILLERLISKVFKPTVLTKDAVDYFINTPSLLLDRPDTVLVLNFNQLQKLFISAKNKQAITFDMQHSNFTTALYDASKTYKAGLVAQRNKYIYCAIEGQVSVTEYQQELKSWRLQAATNVAVWWMQNPNKQFQSITTALAV